MTALQTAFIAALTVVVVATTAVGVIVARSASRSSATAVPTPQFLLRLARDPASRVDIPRWAYIGHRVSGIAVAGFLLLHLVDVGLIAISPAFYDEVHALYGSPLLRVFEVGLWGAIVFHTLNGLRLIVSDIAPARWLNSTAAHTAILVTTMVSTLAGGAIILGPLLP